MTTNEKIYAHNVYLKASLNNQKIYADLAQSEESEAVMNYFS